ncbi:MAG: hypothetical protein JJ896_13315 [Rhodothermales bacterium]|nr:hypothetical protein [Rhodothermales bacterium]MBO6780626.1 hypothetical protein [Rhodothermales bacterium]
MNAKSIVGVVLIVIGVIGFIFGGIPYTSNETVLDAGPIEIEAEQEKSFPIAPVASGLMLVGGVFLLAAGRKS